MIVLYSYFGSVALADGIVKMASLWISCCCIVINMYLRCKQEIIFVSWNEMGLLVVVSYEYEAAQRGEEALYFTKK